MPVAADVDAVATAGEARQALSRTPYALILLDGLLPDLHGVDLAMELVATPHGRAAAICFVSGSIRRALPAVHSIGALPKPIRVRDLLVAATELLEGRGTPPDLAQRQAHLRGLRSELLVA